MEQITDITKYLEIVKKKLDAEWIFAEYDKIKKYYSTKKNTRVLGKIEDYANPLAYLLFQTEKNVTERKNNSRVPISNEAIDIVRLGIYVERLESIKSEGFDKKFTELQINDKEKFEKFFNEIDIASGFAKSKHKVEFLDTRSNEQKKTPDLLIDGMIEIECKKKDKFSSRDIKNFELCNVLQRKSIQLMNENKKYYLLYAYFEEDPTNENIKDILKKLREIISTGSNSEFLVGKIKIIADLICQDDETIHIVSSIGGVSEMMIDINPDDFDNIIAKKVQHPELLDYLKNRPDYDHTPFHPIPRNDGLIEIHEAMKFLFKFKDESDRIKSILNSINTAKCQLSSDKIGLIGVNITHFSEKMMQSDFEELSYKLNNILKNNTKISGVLISSEFHIKDANGIRFLHNASVIRNNHASNPLPFNFKIMN